jgi:hypothetical protein
LGSFWTKSVWPVCQTGLTGFPCPREAKSNRSGLTGFRNRPDWFGLPAAVSCVFPLRVCCGCWLGLAPRFSSTSVAVWTWQEKLAEVHEWNRVHRPNSWIEFLSAPIHSPLSGSPFRSFTYTSFETIVHVALLWSDVYHKYSKLSVVLFVLLIWWEVVIGFLLYFGLPFARSTAPPCTSVDVPATSWPCILPFFQSSLIYAVNVSCLICFNSSCLHLYKILFRLCLFILNKSS